MPSDQVSRRDFSSSRTVERAILDARPSRLAAAGRTDSFAQKYRLAATTRGDRGRCRGLSALRSTPRCLADEPCVTGSSGHPAQLVADRPLRPSANGAALDYCEPGALLDNAHYHAARCTVDANRPLSLFEAPQLPAGNRRDRRAASRVWRRRDRRDVFRPQLDIARPAHLDRGSDSRTAPGVSITVTPAAEGCAEVKRWVGFIAMST